MEYIFHMLDYKDKKILNILKENSKLSTQQISKKTFIPITTVHHRIKKLEKEGVIKGYTVLLDDKKLSKNLSAYIMISADLKLLKEKNKTQYDLVKELKKLPCTEKVDIIVGGIDLINQIKVKNVEELNNILLNKIQKIEGISDTQTLVVIHEG